MNFIHLTYTSGLSLLAVALTACSADEKIETMSGKAQLEVSLEPITRNIVEGSTLPDGHSFGISFFGNPALNQEVKYEKGHCNLTSPINLDATSRTVYAYYPYSNNMSNNLKEGLLYVGSATQDMLVGHSSNTVNWTNKTAYIQMEHVQSYITLNIVLDNQFYGQGKLTRVAFEGACAKGYVNVETGNVASVTEYSFTTEANHNLDQTKTVCLSYMLLPTEVSEKTVLSLTVDGSVKMGTFSTGRWEKGKRYTYDIIVHGVTGIEISNPQITKWQDGGSLTGEIIVEENSNS